MPFSTDGDAVVAENGAIRVTFDATTGGVARLEHLGTGAVVAAVEAPEPWRLTPQGTSWFVMPFLRPPSYELAAIVPTSCAHTVNEARDRCRFTWTTSDPGVTVEVDAAFAADALELRPRVVVGDDVLPPVDLTYPILGGLRPLSTDGERDQLVYPAHSGWVIRRPLAQLPVASPYPDGYHGCSMQFTAYIEERAGGVYLATHDPHGTWKTLRFGAAEWSIQHDTWDLRRGVSVDYGYPVVIAPLNAGDWFEPAERYRRWALSEAPWCAAGNEPGAVDRSARRWLHEEVGLAIWGTPSSIDWTPWYEFYAEVAGTPLHICAGWDWPATRPHQVGKEGWFPARFHPANLEAWRGHHVTPYMNDIFVSSRAERFLEHWEPNLVFPYATFPWTPFSQRSPEWIEGDAPDPDPAVTTDLSFFVCPATEALSDLHAWRATSLVQDYGLDGACYDISSGNVLLASRCLRQTHGHPPGRGRAIVQAYDELNRRSRAAVWNTTGRYLVQGVEVVNETVVGSVDFYVARAGAGPLGALEAWLPAPEEPPGTGRELVPLFQAVYHDVGPLLHDGWLDLARETGDLFHWIAARVVLQWGGLLSLHYANQAPERLEGHDFSEAVNWDGATLRFEDFPEADPAKVAFVRELALARTRLATPYLAHGRMLRPVPIDVPTITLDFSQRFHGVPGLHNHGAWDVPSVVCGAWEAPDGAVAVLLVSLPGDRGTEVPLVVDLISWWDRSLAGRTVVVRTREGTRSAGKVGPDNALDVTVDLPPRTVTVVELAP